MFTEMVIGTTQPTATLGSRLNLTVFKSHLKAKQWEILEYTFMQPKQKTIQLLPMGTHIKGSENLKLHTTKKPENIMYIKWYRANTGNYV